MTNNQQRSRFVIWSVVIVCLVFGFLFMWDSVEDEARNTALIVASKRMVERANTYKQQYLLHGKVGRADIEYSQSGWVRPVVNGQPNCELWLELLYPKRKVLGFPVTEVEDLSSDVKFQCIYHYTNKYMIDISLSGERFSIKANILAL